MKHRKDLRLTAQRPSAGLPRTTGVRSTAPSESGEGRTSGLAAAALRVGGGSGSPRGFLPPGADVPNQEPYIRPDAPYIEPSDYARTREDTIRRWVQWAMVVALLVGIYLIGSAIADIQTGGQPYRPVGVPMTVGPALTSAPPAVQP